MFALVFAVLSLSQGVAVVFACGIAGCGEVGGNHRGEEVQMMMSSSSSFSTTWISYGLKTFLFVLVSIAVLQFILSTQRKERKQIVIDQEQKIINPIAMMNSKATTTNTTTSTSTSTSLEHEPLSSSMKQLQEPGHQHQKNEKHPKIIKKSNRNKKQRSIGGSSSKLSSASVSTCSIASAQNPAEEVETKEKELIVIEKKVDCMEKEEKDVGMELNPAAPEFIPHVPNLMKPEQQDPEFNPCFSVLRALSLFDDEKDDLLDACL